MSRIYKSEAYLFFIAIILYMLVVKAGVPSLIYMFYSALLAVYFFPVKIIVKFKTEKPLPLIASSFIIAWFLIYAGLVLYIDYNLVLKTIMILMIMVNLLFLYYFYKKKNNSMALHLLAFAIIPMILYP